MVSDTYKRLLYGVSSFSRIKKFAFKNIANDLKAKIIYLRDIEKEVKAKITFLDQWSLHITARIATIQNKFDRSIYLDHVWEIPDAVAFNNKGVFVGDDIVAYFEAIHQSHSLTSLVSKTIEDLNAALPILITSIIDRNSVLLERNTPLIPVSLNEMVLPDGTVLNVSNNTIVITGSPKTIPDKLRVNKPIFSDRTKFTPVIRDFKRVFFNVSRLSRLLSRIYESVLTPDESGHVDDNEFIAGQIIKLVNNITALIKIHLMLTHQFFYMVKEVALILQQYEDGNVIGSSIHSEKV